MCAKCDYKRCLKTTPIGSYFTKMKANQVALAEAKLQNDPHEIRWHSQRIDRIRANLRARGISYG